MRNQCAEKDKICGVVEVNESCFGATRPRGSQQEQESSNVGVL